MTRVNTLFVVSNEFEAKQALSDYKEGDIIFATTLSAEFTVSEVVKNYVNPFYSIVGHDGSKVSEKYIFPNFSVAHKFAADSPYFYVRDRFGYFLAEFEKSIDVAQKALSKYKVKKIAVGEPKKFPGASILYGSLKTNAFLLLASEKRIPCRVIKSAKKRRTVRSIIGPVLQRLRAFRHHDISGNCDVLIIATARHLVQMSKMIEDLKRSGIEVRSLTHNMTLGFGQRLSKLKIDYWERRKLFDAETLKGAADLNKEFRSKRPWKNFHHNRYGGSLRSKLKEIATDEMGEVFGDVALSGKIFAKITPKVLVTTTDPDTKILPYIIEAKKKGIKTICIQHGAFYPFDSPATFPVSDYFVTWSGLTRKALTSSDYFRKKEILVGSSPFHVKQKPRKRVENKSILFLTSVHLVDQIIQNYYLKRLFKVFDDLGPGYHITIRMHPNQVQFSSDIMWLAKNSKIPTIVDSTSSLQDAIASSGVVIYEDTTAGFDAMLAMRPTIYFNPYTGEDFFDVVDHGASFAVLNDKDLGKMADFLLKKQLLEKYSKKGYNFAMHYLGLKDSGKNALIIRNLAKP